MRQTRSPRRNSVVIAGAHAADEIAVSVELADPAAAAVAVIVVPVIGGDRAADDRGTDEAGAHAPAPTERLGLSLRGGGRDRACYGKGSKGERGNPGLERHLETPSGQGGTVVVRMPLRRRLVDSGSIAAPGASARDDYLANTVT